MPRKASGAIKVGTIRERQKNGDIYIYERKTKYDPNKKYSDTISKILIGKIVNGTDEIVDTRPKRRIINPTSGPGVAPPEITRRHVGMLDIICHVADKSGITAEINRAVGRDRGIAQKIQTLAWYAFATDGETWLGIKVDGGQKI